MIVNVPYFIRNTTLPHKYLNEEPLKELLKKTMKKFKTNVGLGLGASGQKNLKT